MGSGLAGGGAGKAVGSGGGGRAEGSGEQRCGGGGRRGGLGLWESAGGVRGGREREREHRGEPVSWRGWAPPGLVRRSLVVRFSFPRSGCTCGGIRCGVCGGSR